MLSHEREIETNRKITLNKLEPKELSYNRIKEDCELLLFISYNHF